MSAPVSDPTQCLVCGCHSATVLGSPDGLCVPCAGRIWQRRQARIYLARRLEAELSAPPAPVVARQPPPPLPTKATEAGTPPARLLDACLFDDPAPLTWRQRLVYALGVPALLTLVGLVVIGLGAGVTVFLGNLPR